MTRNPAHDDVDKGAQARWRERLASKVPTSPSGDPPTSASSVLIPLVFVGAHPLVLYTRRAEHLPTHPGEVSFPGGGRQETDRDLEDAALRETREEVGILPGDVDVLGHATDLETRGGVWIRAFVGIVDRKAALADPTTPEEVEERLLVPLEALLDGHGDPPVPRGESVSAGEGTFGRAVPVASYESRRVTQGEEEGLVLHYWSLGPETTIWGITGGITARFLESALGWTPPKDPRPIDGEDEVYP